MPERPYVPLTPGPLSRAAAQELRRQLQETERLARLVPSPPIIGHDSGSGRLLSVDAPEPALSVVTQTQQHRREERIERRLRIEEFTPLSRRQRIEHSESRRSRRTVYLPGFQGGMRCTATSEGVGPLTAGQSAAFAWDPTRDTGSFIDPGSPTRINLSGQNTWPATLVATGSIEDDVNATDAEVEILVANVQGFDVEVGWDYAFFLENERLDVEIGDPDEDDPDLTLWTLERRTLREAHASGSTITVWRGHEESLGSEGNANYFARFLAAISTEITWAGSNASNGIQVVMDRTSGLQLALAPKSTAYAGSLRQWFYWTFSGIAVPARIGVYNAGLDTITVGETTLELIQTSRFGW